MAQKYDPSATIQFQSPVGQPAQPGIFPKLPKWMQGTADGLGKIAKGFGDLNAKSLGGDPSKATALGRVGGVLGIVSGGLTIMSLFSDSGETPDQRVAREIGNIKTMIQDLSDNQNLRFDRVDQSLVTIFDTLNTEFDKITMSFDAQGRQIATLNGNVNQIRATLVDVQTDLHRLERHLLNYLNELDARDLNTDLNFLGYEANFNVSMRYQDEYIPSETAFFTHARNNSVDGLSAPYLDRDYTATGLLNELLNPPAPASPTASIRTSITSRSISTTSSPPPADGGHLASGQSPGLVCGRLRLPATGRGDPGLLSPGESGHPP